MKEKVFRVKLFDALIRERPTMLTKLGPNQKSSSFGKGYKNNLENQYKNAAKENIQELMSGKHFKPYNNKWKQSIGMLGYGKLKHNKRYRW